MASIEEKVEEHYKKILDELGIRHYGKTESINRTITDALRSADSKSGGSGNNYPDIQLLLENKTARRIPVMIEAKGLKNRLEKISKSGQIELITYYEKDSKRKDGTIQHHAGDANYSSIMNYAVNGAVHYANAILDSRGYTEVIAIGINGTQMNADGSVQDAECRAYYISEKNNRVPKHIPELDKGWSLLKADNLDRFFAMLDKMTLTEKELEDLRQRTETALETKIKSIHQSLYDNPTLRTALTTNEKLYLFCGLIMVGLTTKGVAPLDVNQFTGNDDQEDNDSTIIITRIRSFLKKKKCGDDKIRMILDLLQPVFKKETLWRPVNGESILKSLFKQVKQDIIPCLESNLHLDFTGKILNSLGDWVHIENDRENDVVLTPRYVTTLMAKLARTNMDSFVWDRAMGSAGFLVSAMDIMIKDAQAKIHDQKELEKKITNIKEHQLLGVEILGNIYILAVLNMILMGDGSSNIYNGDGHDYNNETGKFPATVFLLNPPYSADGKGFNFVQEALETMTSGYACILIQENAGSGNGLPYTKKILEKNTLCASVHMSDIFCGKSSVQTAIYVFQVARPHEVDDMVDRTMYEGLKKFFPEGFTYEEFTSGSGLGIMEANVVGPTMADDIKTSTVWALVFSLAGIFLYILFRFRKWQYSAGCVAASIHNVIVVCGAFALLHGVLPFSMQIDQTFVAAILTVIGYALNDNVIVFDRIREEIRNNPRKDVDMLSNMAINKTLSRTINTSLTTFLVVLVIFIWGGDSIRGIMFAIGIGIIVGTYSSIFTATPVMLDLLRFSKDREKALQQK